jgi:hypothetical protein
MGVMLRADVALWGLGIKAHELTSHLYKSMLEVARNSSNVALRPD